MEFKYNVTGSDRKRLVTAMAERLKCTAKYNGTDPDAVKAYTHFVTALCEMARNQKRITSKEKDTDNDKYAFRCFLLRLGFIGESYKQERKILLRNLSGSSAFKSGNPKVQEMVNRIKAEADLYDDVMILQDKEAANDEISE